MTNAEIHAALNAAHVNFRNDGDGDKWHIPQMGMGWHATSAVIAWLQGR